MGKFNHILKIPYSEKPRLVIIGAGFAGLNLLQDLKKSDFQVVLIDWYNYHTFQPLLYQVATAGLEPDAIAGPIRKIIRNKDIVFANWIWNYFTFDRGIRLILRPSTKMKDEMSIDLKNQMKESISS